MHDVRFLTISMQSVIWYSLSSLVFKTEYHGIVGIKEIEINDPNIDFTVGGWGSLKPPASTIESKRTKVLDCFFQQCLDFFVVIRPEMNSDRTDRTDRKGGVWHSPMLAHSDDPTLLALRIGL